MPQNLMTIGLLKFQVQVVDQWNHWQISTGRANLKGGHQIQDQTFEFEVDFHEKKIQQKVAVI